MTCFLEDVAYWLRSYQSARISVARVEVSRALAESLRDDAVRAYSEALHGSWPARPHGAYENKRFHDAICDGEPFGATMVFGCPVVMVPDMAAAPLRFIPVRNPLIFGASVCAAKAQPAAAPTPPALPNTPPAGTGYSGDGKNVVYFGSARIGPVVPAGARITNAGSA